MRLPDFLQFTPDERRAALALLLFTGGGGLLLEIGKRHPEWMPDLVAVRRGQEATAPAGGPASSPKDSAALPAQTMVASLLPATAADEAGPPTEVSLEADLQAPADSTRRAGSAPSAPRRAASKKKADPLAPVDVNTADVAALMTLPGIGPALAQRIVDDRAANGPYKSVEDLARVKGIGKAAVERLRPVVRTE